MTEASAAEAARFERRYGVRLPPCAVTVDYLVAILDRRHHTVVPPLDSVSSYRWYCACGQQGQSKKARHVAVSGGVAHQGSPSRRKRDLVSTADQEHQ